MPSRTPSAPIAQPASAAEIRARIAALNEQAAIIESDEAHAAVAALNEQLAAAEAAVRRVAAEEAAERQAQLAAAAADIERQGADLAARLEANRRTIHDNASEFRAVEKLARRTWKAMADAADDSKQVKRELDDLARQAARLGIRVSLPTMAGHLTEPFQLVSAAARAVKLAMQDDNSRQCVMADIGAQANRLPGQIEDH